MQNDQLSRPLSLSSTSQHDKHSQGCCTARCRRCRCANTISFGRRDPKTSVRDSDSDVRAGANVDVPGERPVGVDRRERDEGRGRGLTTRDDGCGRAISEFRRTPATRDSPTRNGGAPPPMLTRAGYLRAVSIWSTCPMVEQQTWHWVIEAGVLRRGKRTCEPSRAESVPQIDATYETVSALWA